MSGIHRGGITVTRGEDVLESRYFRLEEVAEGIWAAISTPGAGSMGNAGIVDLGDATLVFDTMLIPQAAQDVRAAAERLTGRAVQYVVNSHFHGDHVLGNMAFPDAIILGTSRTRELIAERTAAEIAEAQRDLASFARQFDDEEQRLAAETDTAKREQGALDLADWRQYQQALPTLRVALPTLTFDTRMVLHGSKRRAELVTYGGGHTDSDAVLHLPDDRLMLTGDLLFVRAHPLMIDGHPADWVAILERIEAMDLQTLVPGHGPVGTLTDAAAVRRYLRDVVALARDAVARGMSADAMKELPVPAAYAAWDAAPTFRWNMQFLHDEATKPSE